MKKEVIMKSLAVYNDLEMNDLIKEGNLRDLGKMFGGANEHVQCDWIAENTSFLARKRSDFDNDPDASGYDLKTQNGMLIQSKVRVKDIHLEQTRRKSAKNDGDASSTGHVSYSVDEFDVLLVSRPLGNKATKRDKYTDTSRPIEEYPDVEKWDMIAIPEYALYDPKRPEFLRNSVPKSIWSQYVGRAVEVLEEVYESVSNR
jgi:hypothetical protein|tara:strand:+ start:26 stop:631 length:606 start_codon:yes stop_codon:yes gene_type:complete